MDHNEENMKFIGFFGIFKQSFKSIFSAKKLFTLITLISILPLTLIYLADLKISNRFFWRIENNSLPFETHNSREANAVEWIYYLLYKIVYFTLLIIFSLLSTATIVFTVTSIHTGREIVFLQVMKIVPRIWKKLFLTFVFIYLALFMYDVIYRVIMIFSRAIFGYTTLGYVIMFTILLTYISGFLYLTVVLQLASVVTILENIRGFNAIKKGKQLANGKKNVGMAIAFVLYVVLVGLIVLYVVLVGLIVLYVVLVRLILVYFWSVEYADGISKWALIWRVLLRILCVILVMVYFLVFIVTQTVLYLVCKSYHREEIDKLSLSTFLGTYTGETVVYPKPGEEIQLGRPQSQQV